MSRLLPKTDPHVDLREADRLACPRETVLCVLPEQSFWPWQVTVKDVSAKGIGLLSPRPLEPGTRLALQWHFGPPLHWRNLFGRVINLSPAKGLFLVGCEFEGLLRPEEVSILLAKHAERPRPGSHGRERFSF